MSNTLSAEQQYALLYAKLNQETAKIPWQELLRHFASGNVIVVRDGIDLIDVATRMANDDKGAITTWLTDGSVAKVTDAQAGEWMTAELALWTVVVKPWVLVQQDKGTNVGIGVIGSGSLH